MADIASKHGFRWLSVTGSAYLARIKTEQPLFLSDLAIDEQQLEALFAALRNHGYIGWSDETRACLAIAAVGSALYASEQDLGFREQFFRHLGTELNSDWDNLYGPQILRFLVDHFDEIDRPGPFRYVRAIYHHAGISQRALPSFAQFIRDLRSRYGFDYTNWQYRQLLETGRVPSRFAKDFLSADAGYEFTLSVTRILEELERGRSSVGELEQLPGFRKGFWTELLEHLDKDHSENRLRKSLPVPALALDFLGQRLVVKFDEDGVAKRLYSIDGSRPAYPFEQIRHHGRISGLIFHPGGDIEPWALEPWFPGKTPWALFRGSDGVFVASEGKVPAGSYFLVGEDGVIPSEIIEEDCGYLDWESNALDSRPYHIWKISLRSGLQIESIGLETLASEAIPSLDFDRAPGESEFGPNVFIDYLPLIKVKNWTDSSGLLYRVVLDQGDGPVEVDQQIEGSRLLLPVACPSAGRIWIEPRGRVRHMLSMLPEVHFHVIPGPIRLQFPKVAIGEEDSAEVWVISPRNWNIKWKHPLTELQAQRWVIPPRVRVLEGSAEVEGRRVPISIRVRRCSLSLLPARELPHVLWSEEVNESAELLIEGVPHLDCSLALLIERDSVTLCRLGPLGPSGLLAVKGLVFRDYLAQTTIPCGEFAVVTGRQIVPTGKYFIASEHIPDFLKSANEDCTFFQIIEVGPTLKSLWSIQKAPQKEAVFATRLSTSPLWRFIADVGLSAARLDQTRVNIPLEQLRVAAASGLPSLLDILEAMENAAIDKKSTDISNLDLTLLPLERWREKATRVIEQHFDLQDIPNVVREWQCEIRSGLKVEYQSRLSKRKGGRDLTHAAIKYQAAVKNANMRAYDAAYGILLRLTNNRPDLLVKAVALGLVQLVLFRSERLEEAAGISSSDLPKGFTRLAAEMSSLAALCRGQALKAQPLPTGIGFGDLSPVEEDQNLLLGTDPIFKGALGRRGKDVHE
jgi:hypothetical protein